MSTCTHSVPCSSCFAPLETIFASCQPARTRCLAPHGFFATSKPYLLLNHLHALSALFLPVPPRVSQRRYRTCFLPTCTHSVPCSPRSFRSCRHLDTVLASYQYARTQCLLPPGDFEVSATSKNVFASRPPARTRCLPHGPSEVVATLIPY